MGAETSWQGIWDSNRHPVNGLSAANSARRRRGAGRLAGMSMPIQRVCRVGTHDNPAGERANLAPETSEFNPLPRKDRILQEKFRYWACLETAVMPKWQLV